MRKTLPPLLLAIVLAACSGGDAGGPVLTFADFNNPSTTPQVLGEGSGTTTVPSSTTSTSSTTTTLLVIDTPVAVTITTDTDFSLLTNRGAPRRLIDGPVEVALDDLQGGVVFQLPGAGRDTSADQRIFWSRAASPEAQPYLDVGDGSLLRLWGIEEIGGSPQLILTIVDPGEGTGDPVERLVLFDFVSGDRVLGEVGAENSGPIAISYGGGRFLLDQRFGVQSFFEFRNDQGAVVELASNPQPGCTAEDVSCPAHPALDPSGSFVAFLEADSAGGAELVVFDLDLAEEVDRIVLPDGLGDVDSLEFNGTTVIVNRRVAGSVRALIVDLAGGGIGDFGLEGHIRFLRQPPAFDGAVEVPAG